MSEPLPLQEVIYLCLAAGQVTVLWQRKRRVSGAKFHFTLSQILFLPPPHH